VSEPERQCIGCGRRGPQNGFLRLALDRGAEPPRVTATTGTRDRKGRGAYICRRQACLDRALQRRAFQRAFRTALQVDEGEIAAALRTIEAAM
jgi:predicted RNA-binding protein YlxR (DUF448 family)